MKVSVFGNPDLPCDAAPLQMLPQLREAFPDIDFCVEDPEELDLPEEGLEEWIIIDTVKGLPHVAEVPLEKLVAAPRLTAHDFDLGSYLMLAKKLRPGLVVRIIGVPMDTGSVLQEQPFQEVLTLINKHVCLKKTLQKDRIARR